MYDPTVIGVDPGIVHTGIVMLDFNVSNRMLTIDHRVVNGLDAVIAAAEVVTMTGGQDLRLLDTFIEEYRPRSGYSVDQQMMVANAEFKRELRGKLLRNTGVKQVVSRELLQLCNVWTFSTRTHHQDLRSAARIALLGMMREPALNEVLFTYVTNTIDKEDWDVRVN